MSATTAMPRYLRRDHRRKQRVMNSLVLACGLAWPLLLHEARVTAEDRVVVQIPGQSSRITVIGHIVDFTGRELVLQTGVGAGIKRFPAAEVVEVSTSYLPEHQAGLKHLADGDVTAAWQSLSIALEEETRPWVRREILAAQVKCALWTGDLGRGANRFLAIVAADDLSPHYRLMPLVWTETAPSQLSESEALRWLNGKVLPAKLLAASWLLSQPATQAQAHEALKSLAGESHPYIQRLAQAQLWRVRLETGTLSTAEIQRWEQFTESLPEELRGGLYFLIGQAYADRQDWLSSAGAWLWLPLEYPGQRYLAIEAQWRAAQALQSAGDQGAALQLAQEIIGRYADSPQAIEARALVQNVLKRDNPAQ